MLNIKNMIITNDFSALLNSTQEERDKSGGNNTLFNQLYNYLSIDYIKQIVKMTFKDDAKIVKELKMYGKNTKAESLNFSGRDSDLYDFVKLP